MAVSPGVRRRRLGIELRRLRDQSGLLMEAVAKELECSMSKVSRIETGKGAPRIRDVRDMLNMYEVTDPEIRNYLLDLAREAQQQGWWEQYDKVLPPGLNTYLGLESEAAVMRTYGVQFIPGLLQTEGYIRALYLGSRPADNLDDGEQFVAARLARQERLFTDEDPLELWAVIDEAAVRRPVGGPAVMREQLLRIVVAAQRPNITVQVLPVAKAGAVGLCGQFTMLEFADPTDLPAVFVDTPVDNLYFEKPEELRGYQQVYSLLQATALDRDDSIDFLRRVAADFSPTSEGGAA